MNFVPYLELEKLFGGSSMGLQLLIYPWLKTTPLLIREGHPWAKSSSSTFHGVHSFRRDTYVTVRGEGDTA